MPTRRSWTMPRLSTPRTRLTDARPVIAFRRWSRFGSRRRSAIGMRNGRADSPWQTSRPARRGDWRPEAAARPGELRRRRLHVERDAGRRRPARPQRQQGDDDRCNRRHRRRGRDRDRIRGSGLTSHGHDLPCSRGAGTAGATPLPIRRGAGCDGGRRERVLGPQARRSSRGERAPGFGPPGNGPRCQPCRRPPRRPRLRVGTLVLNNDLRHPPVLAQDLAAVDAMTGGRLEIGIGAGWNRPEYEAAGLTFDPPAGVGYGGWRRRCG